MKDSMKMIALWDIAQYSLVEIDRYFIALMVEAARTSET
jgi:hypothetical protein